MNVVSERKQVEKEVAEKQYLSQLEEMILSEPVSLQDLKGNIRANFSIIEDAYRDEFDLYGIEYTYYQSKYPSEKYNKDLWIQEKAEELRKLKLKEFEKIKMQLTRNN